RMKAGVGGSGKRGEGNVTGVYQFTAGLEAKRLGLLHDLVPNAGTLAVLVHPEYSGVESQLRDVQEAAPRLGVQLIIVRANKESDFNAAFSAIRPAEGCRAPSLRVPLLQYQAPTARPPGGAPCPAGYL